MSEEVIPEEAFLNAIQYPTIIVDKGKIVRFNSLAEQTFKLSSAPRKGIVEIWPDYHFREATSIEEIIFPEDTIRKYAVIKTQHLFKDLVLVSFRIGDEQPRTLEPDRGYGSPSWLEEKLNRLMKIMKQLNRFNTPDEIYKNTVILTRKHLDIDRLAILLINQKKNTYYGTWGTDDKGNLKNESGFEAKMNSTGWMKETFGSPVYSIFQENNTLCFWGSTVGKGWNAMISLWKGDTVIGWIAADNLLSQRPLTASVKELFRQLGASLSQLLSFKDAEFIREKQQQKLEILIKEKTEELNRQYGKNLLINRKLTEQETLKALGEHVTGVAHDLNTPIGIGITAASWLKDRTEETIKAFDSGKLSVENLQVFLSDVHESGTILNSNLQEASRLVKTFKKTSVNQVSDRLIEFNLKELIETIILSHKYRWKKRNINVEVKIPEELTVYSYPGLITQVISNLLINSLKHAFPNTDRGNILIEAGKSGDGINLVFSDNGCGIPEEQHEKIFESFFTTARDSGGSGLGLYLVRDIVENQLNGSLLLDSRPGKGTRFIITLSD